MTALSTASREKIRVAVGPGLRSSVSGWVCTTSGPVVMVGAAGVGAGVGSGAATTVGVEDTSNTMSSTGLGSTFSVADPVRVMATGWGGATGATKGSGKAGGGAGMSWTGAGAFSG